MSLATELLDRLRITPFKAREAREAARTREVTIARLEARAASLKSRIESYDYDDDNWLDPREQYMDGGDYYPPQAMGTVNDRKFGRNYPFVRHEMDLRWMRSTSRTICQRNMFAIGFLDRVVDFLVGDGYKWQVSLKGANPGAVHSGQADIDPSVQACQAVLDEWKKLNSWGDGPWAADPCNPYDDIGLIQNREREAASRWRRDGEVFLRWFPGTAATNNLPIVRWVEPEQVWLKPGESDASEHSQGIFTDDDDSERIVSYWLRNVADGGATGEEVPAGQITHLKANVDATIKRGVPDFSPLAGQLERVRKLLEAMGEVAAILAKISYLRQHAEGVSSTQVNAMIERQKDYTKPRARSQAANTKAMQNADLGEVHDIGAGMAYVAPPLQAGAPGFIQVEQAILRACGARWGMPEFFSGDASNNSFASLAASGGPFDRATKSRQKEYGQFQQAIAAKVLAFACVSGRLSKADVMAVEVTCVAPEVAVIDSLKETQRREILNRAKVLSPQTWAAQEGEDPAQEFANLKAFDEQFPDAGTGGNPFGDMFGGGSGSGGDPTPPNDGGKPFGESIIEGFTGTKTGADGHKYHYRDGKRVSGDAPAKTEPKSASGGWAMPEDSIYSNVPKAGNNTSGSDTEQARNLVGRLDKYEQAWIDHEVKNPTASESELHFAGMQASGLTGDGLRTARGYAGKKPTSKPGVLYPDAAPVVPADAGTSGADIVKQHKAQSTGYNPTQPRAKVGGEVGPNREPYAGGQFIATTDMPKSVRAKIQKAASGKVLMDFQKNTWGVPEPGQLSIANAVNGTYVNLRNGAINYQYLDYIGADAEHRSQVEKAAKAFADGKLTVDAVEFYHLAKFDDIARMMQAEQPLPGAMVPRAKEIFGANFERYKPNKEPQ